MEGYLIGIEVRRSMVENVSALGFGGCRCDDQNRNKEIERVARPDRGQWRFLGHRSDCLFDLNVPRALIHRDDGFEV